MMDDDFKNRAMEYLERVNAACLLIMEGMRFPLPTDPMTWISVYPTQTGKFELNGVNRFFLHGFGCNFKGPEFSIQWDFGMNGEWNGIAPWMFADFIRSNGYLGSKFKDWLNVEEELNAAVLIGEMEKRGDHYYFLDQQEKRDLSNLLID